MGQPVTGSLKPLKLISGQPVTGNLKPLKMGQPVTGSLKPLRMISGQPVTGNLKPLKMISGQPVTGNLKALAMTNGQTVAGKPETRGKIDSEVIGIDASISPIRTPSSYSIASATKGNIQTKESPLADRLNHGLVKITPLSLPSINPKEGNFEKQQSFRQQSLDARSQQSLPVALHQHFQAQFAQIQAPATKLEEEEKMRNAKSSAMLSRFLKENSQGGQHPTEGWDKRKSMIPPVDEINADDSDITSKSVIPRLPGMPISEEEIVKFRKSHLHNRLTELKRKRSRTDRSVDNSWNHEQSNLIRLKRT